MDVGWRMVVAIGLLAGVIRQTPGATLTGIARDRDGGLLPGVTITLTADELRRQTITDPDGRYRLAGVKPGVYRLEAELAGFRRTRIDCIVGERPVEHACDVAMRVGILALPDYIHPPDGLRGAVRAAAAVAHLRIVETRGPRLLGRNENYLTTEHAAAVLSVVKGADRGLAPRSTVTIWQADAGTWTEDGRTTTEERRPYRTGQELVALFYRDESGRLVEYLGGHYSFLVVDGRVPHQDPGGMGGIENGLPVETFLARIRSLIGPPAARYLGIGG